MLFVDISYYLLFKPVKFLYIFFLPKTCTYRKNVVPLWRKNYV